MPISELDTAYTVVRRHSACYAGFVESYFTSFPYLVLGSQPLYM